MSEEIVVAPTQAMTLAERRNLLTVRERLVYDVIAANPKVLRQLSSKLTAEMYSLFLHGKSTEDIVALNHPAVTLSDVVWLRIQNRWDENRNEYRTRLMEGVKDRLIQTNLESSSFLSDQLAALHKYQGDRVARFLATGDTQFLDGVMIHSIRNYKEVVELLMAITGQSPAKKVNVSGEVDHNLTTGAPAPEGGKKGLSSSQAAKILAALLEGEEK